MDYLRLFLPLFNPRNLSFPQARGVSSTQSPPSIRNCHEGQDATLSSSLREGFRETGSHTPGKHKWTLSFHRQGHHLRRKSFLLPGWTETVAVSWKTLLCPKPKKCISRALHLRAGEAGAWPTPAVQAAQAAELWRGLDGCHCHGTAQHSRACPASCQGSHCSRVLVVMHQHLGTRHTAVVILTHNGYRALQVKVYIRYLRIPLSPISAGMNGQRCFAAIVLTKLCL